MKKILLIGLFCFTQNTFSQDCTKTEANNITNKFFKNEISCGIDRSVSCEIAGKELISQKDMLDAGIRIFRAQKYVLNTVLIEDYKIMSINNKEASIEIYNYSNNWYKTLKVRFVKEDGECYFDAFKISKGKGYEGVNKNKEVFYIHPYFNMIHHGI